MAHSATSSSASTVPPPPGAQRARFAVRDVRAAVVSNHWVNGEYKLLVIEAGDAALAARPGQFFHLACPSTGADQPLLRRPMSIYRIDRAAAEVRFLYKVQGAGTRGLATLAPGDRLGALGPLGHGFELPSNTRHVLLLARGVGLATLAPLAAEAISRGAHVTGILSARRPDLVMSADELRDAGATVCPVTDDDGSSDVARLERRILDLHARMPIDFFATCGSNRLLLLLQRLGETLGVAGQVALEQHMGCALGMCYACVRPLRAAPGQTDLTYRRVCHDGPVFDLREALSW